MVLRERLKEDQGLAEPKMTGETKQKFEARIQRFEAQLSALSAFEENKFAQVDLVSNPFEICKSGESTSLKEPAGVFSLYFERPVEANFLSSDALVMRLTNILVNSQPEAVLPVDAESSSGESGIVK